MMVEKYEIEREANFLGAAAKYWPIFIYDSYIPCNLVVVFPIHQAWKISPLTNRHG